MAVWSLAAFLLLAAGSPPLHAQDQTAPAAGYRIDTVAGRPAFVDGGPAIAARMVGPDDVAVDGAGNLFIADTYRHRIRMVDASGTITTVAGSESGFGGDGGPAVEAQLLFPLGVAVDGAGNLFIADTSNNRIRMVDASGTITTVAGSGGFGYLVPGGDGGDGGPAVEAELYSPRGVAVDGAGNLFIADSSNNRIRMVDASGTITTVAGTGESGFGGDGGPAVEAELYSPRGVAVDGAGNLFIADTSNHRIRMVDASGTITTVVGTGESGFGGDGGPAVEAEFDRPFGVAVDSAGNLFIADTSNHRIRMVDSTGTITTVAGTGASGFGGDGGPAVEAEFDRPFGVAVDSAGNLFIADTSNHRIRMVDPAGTITTVAGTGASGFGGDGGPAGGPAVEARLRSPRGVAVDGARATSSSPIPRTTASAWSTRRAPSPPSPAEQAECEGTAGTAGPRSRRSSTAPLTWPSTARATSSSPIPRTTASAWSIRPGRSPPSPGPESTASAGTAVRQSQRECPCPMTWPSTARATSSSPIPTTTAFAN